MVAKDSEREPVIAVLGHYGNRNLGDESIIAATLRGLRQAMPGVVPIAVSMDPADSARRHGVAAFPVRLGARSPAVEDPSAKSAEPVPPVSGPTRTGLSPGRPGGAVTRLIRPIRGLARRLRELARECAFLARVWRFARSADLVMVTGSNQFLDNFGGASGYPWTLFKWALMARLARTPVAFVSVGAGPLTGRMSRLLARAALGLAVYVSWRDGASRALVEGGRREWRGHVYPDLAFTLRPDLGKRADTVGTIGINPMPVYDARYWPDADADRYAHYVAVMAETVARLRRDGRGVFLYAMQPGDERVIEDIVAALRETGAGDSVPTYAPASVEELFGVLQSADLLVPTRFHGTVLGLTCGRPVFSICYHRKTVDVMSAVGLPESLLPLDELDVDRLIDGVRRLTERVPAVYGLIDDAIDVRRRELDEQYAHIAKIVGQHRHQVGEAEAKPS